jgi:hypothetical protein
VLNQAFKDHNISFRAETKQSPNYGGDAAHSVGIVGAETHGDGTIVVELSPDFHRAIQDDVLFNRVISYVTSIIRHELTHRYQHAKSDQRMLDQNPKRNVGKMGEWEQYYSDPHEIFAMAQEIVEQLVQHKLTKDQIIAALQDKRNTILMKNSPRFAEIASTLVPVKDPQGMLPRLKKLIYQALQG